MQHISDAGRSSASQPRSIAQPNRGSTGEEPRTVVARLMTSSFRLKTLIATITMIGVVINAGCATPPPKKKPAPPPEPIAVAEILKSVQGELAKMQEIYDLQRRSGHLLSELNRKLQQRSFSRRVPSQPAVQSLESDLRAHAQAMTLELAGWQVRVRPAPPVAKKGTTLQAHETWKLGVADLKGMIDARITVKGPLPAITKFVDGIPNHVERAVWLTGQTPVPGGIRFDLLAYYEHSQPQPQTEIAWPTIEERLELAGWKLNDPRLPKAPAYGKLREAVKQGRARVPDLRSVMNVANDFPRWFVRAELLAELTEKIMNVKGEDILKTTPIPVDAPFPRIAAK